MKTLKELVDKINDDSRTVQDIKRPEIIEALEIIAENIINKRTTLLDANTLIAIRHSMMSTGEQMIDEVNTLSQMAADLGRVGGLKTSPAKKKSSRENGKLGGRPRNNWSVVNDNGDVAGHDMSRVHAQTLAAELRDEEPEAGWEAIEGD